MLKVKNISFTRWNRLFIGLVLLFSLSFSVSAQQYTEHEVKAAYLFNFAKFVQWPKAAYNSATSPFIIGVYGDDNFVEILNRTLQNRTINNRRLVIKTFQQPSEITHCHILYIARTNKIDLLEIVKICQKTATLTVGNNVIDFCHSGGIINFTHRAKKRFQINNNSALKSNLLISSKLLSLAEIITDEDPQF